MSNHLDQINIGHKIVFIIGLGEKNYKKIKIKRKKEQLNRQDQTIKQKE